MSSDLSGWKTCRSTFVFVLAKLGLLLLAITSTHAQVSYSVLIDSNYQGYLDQYSLNSSDSFVGNEACVPTSTTNAFVYLQNRYSSLFGYSLAGSTYADWKATDEVLASSSYYNTSPNDGTYNYLIPYVIHSYLSSANQISNVNLSGYFTSDNWSISNPKPSYITDGRGTWNYLYSQLTLGSALIFGIGYNGEGGHALLATGLSWIDTNNDGIIQSSENATLSFLDPLDPATSYGADGETVTGPGDYTSGHVWEDASGDLKLDYTQYLGALPYEGSKYSSTGTTSIEFMFGIQAVPEPSTVYLLLLAVSLLNRRAKVLR